MGKRQKRHIAPVADNMDKSLTYRSHMTAYKIAVEKRFYIEAITIAYAAMEDRLYSFYYHIGAIETRCSKAGAIQKAEVERVINVILKANVGKKKYQRNTTKAGEERVINIGQISNKIQVLCAIMLSTTRKGQVAIDDPYYEGLSSALSKIDAKKTIATLQEILIWNEYRNEIVHALFNKSVESLMEELAEHAEKGKVYFQFLDKLASCAKDAGLRQKLGLSE